MFSYFISVTSYLLDSGIHICYSWWDSGGNDVSHLSWHIGRTCCSALLQPLLPWTVPPGVEIWVFLLSLLQVFSFWSKILKNNLLKFSGRVWEWRKEDVCALIDPNGLLVVIKSCHFWNCHSLFSVQI